MLALAQTSTLIGDLEGAARCLREQTAAAAAQGARLIIFPELVACGGYPPRDLLERRWFVAAQWRMVQEVARSLPIPALIGAAEPLEPGAGPALANSLVVCDPARGGVVGSYRKRLLPNYDVFDERRYFRPGDGPQVVELAGLRIGLTVCEDIWSADLSGVAYHQDPVGDLVGRCDLVVNASASPWQGGKPVVRQHLLAAVARRVGAPVVYVNQVGGHDELLFDGGSGGVLPDGRCFAAAPRWAPALVLGDPARAVPLPAASDDLTELRAALVMGLRDYCAKTRQARVVLGLSGGIDSALVAALAAEALGPAQVIGLLMPGPYSSPGSLTDAQALAEGLGLSTYTMPISAANAVMTSTLAPVFADSAPGLAEENLQSRLRGVLIMATANKLGAMALTTGNKSELATGYCTIYGDMNGGLGILGDVYKTQVWALSRHLNAMAGRELIPVSSITKPPSAELRPDQTDQDSLPPYEVLDRILKRLLEQGDEPEAVIAAGEDPAIVRRVFHLLEVNEFKRRQSPPILRVTGKAFGIGRRMPIARQW